MFFSQKADVYRKTYSANRVSSDTLVDTINCKIVSSMTNQTGVASGIDYDVYTLYTRSTLKINDTLHVGNDVYRVSGGSKNKGVLLNYNVYVIKISQGQ